MKSHTYFGCAAFVFICAIINTVFMVISLIKTHAPVISIATFMWSIPILAMYIGSVFMLLNGIKMRKPEQHYR